MNTVASAPHVMRRSFLHYQRQTQNEFCNINILITRSQRVNDAKDCEHARATDASVFASRRRSTWQAMSPYPRRRIVAHRRRFTSAPPMASRVAPSIADPSPSSPWEASATPLRSSSMRHEHQPHLQRLCAPPARAATARAAPRTPPCASSTA